MFDSDSAVCIWLSGRNPAKTEHNSKIVLSLRILGIDINCFGIFPQHKKQDMFVRSVHSKAFFNVESKNVLIACLHMFIYTFF